MKYYEIVYGGKTYTLSEDDLRDPILQAKLPEDLTYRVVTKPDSDKVDMGNLFTYSLTEKYGPMKGRELGKVTAKSKADAIAQASAMGIDMDVNAELIGPVEETEKPTTVQGREELLLKRGLTPENAYLGARYFPESASETYNKPYEDISNGSKVRDALSYPGRVLASYAPFGIGRNEGETPEDAMGRTSEDEGTNFGGSVVRSPATMASLPLLPIAEITGPAIGGLVQGSRYAPAIVGATEGATISAPVATMNYATDEDYSKLDAVAETVFGALLGAGFKAGSKAFMEKAKTMIAKAGNYTKDQIDYIYSKLGKFTQRGTKENLQGDIPTKLGDVAKVADVDLNADISKRVASRYKAGIESARKTGEMTPSEYKAKSALLDEFNSAMDDLKKLYDPGEGTEGYIKKAFGQDTPKLSALLNDAKYFYEKDPKLGQIMLDEIDRIRGSFSNRYMPDDYTTGTLSDKLDKITASTRYMEKPAEPVTGGSILGTTIPSMSPEVARTSSRLLEGLKMPSLVGAQDITNQATRYSDRYK